MAAGGPLLLKLHKMSASMHTVQCTAYLAELTPISTIAFVS